MPDTTSTHQLRYLFLSTLLVLFVGLGLFPVLPVYAAQLGASRTTIGLFFALMYAANAAGPVAVGWLAGRIGRRALFIVIAVVSLPAVAVSGQVTALWQLMLLTSFLWFAGGVLNTLVHIWTGMYAARRRRGASFGLMSLANPLGAVLGGLVVGLLLKGHGFGVLFPVLAIVWAVLPFLGLLLHDPGGAAPARRIATQPVRYGRSFHWLLGLSLLSAVGIGVTQLGRSLSMQALDFPASLVASTATVGGLVAIPATLLFGNLADRLGSAKLLATGIALAGLSAVILVNADELWQFSIAAALSIVAQSTTRGLSAALASDLLAPDALTSGLPWVNTVGGAAGIVSFAATGLVMETLGATTAYLAAAGLAGVAVVLLLRLQPQSRATQAAAAIRPAGEAAPQAAPMSC
jgi:MFS family permease